MPNIGERFPRPYEQPQLIAADPDFGRVVCFCERVTAGRAGARDVGPDPAARPRGPAPPHAGDDGPLPGLLLRAPSWRRCWPRDRRDERPARLRRRSGARRSWSGPARPGSRAPWSCAASASPTCSCSSASSRRAASRATAPIRASAPATCIGCSRAPGTPQHYVRAALDAGAHDRDAETMVTGWSPDGRAAAHRPGRAPGAGGPGGRARDRVPRAPAVGAPDRRARARGG